MGAAPCRHADDDDDARGADAWSGHAVLPLTRNAFGFHDPPLVIAAGPPGGGFRADGGGGPDPDRHAHWHRLRTTTPVTRGTVVLHTVYDRWERAPFWLFSAPTTSSSATAALRRLVWTLSRPAPAPAVQGAGGGGRRAFYCLEAFGGGPCGGQGGVRTAAFDPLLLPRALHAALVAWDAGPPPVVRPFHPLDVGAYRVTQAFRLPDVHASPSSPQGWITLFMTVEERAARVVPVFLASHWVDALWVLAPLSGIPVARLPMPPLRPRPWPSSLPEATGGGAGAGAGATLVALLLRTEGLGSVIVAFLPLSGRQALAGSCRALRSRYAGSLWLWRMSQPVPVVPPSRRARIAVLRVVGHLGDDSVAWSCPAERLPALRELWVDLPSECCGRRVHRSRWSAVWSVAAWPQCRAVRVHGVLRAAHHVDGLADALRARDARHPLHELRVPRCRYPLSDWVWWIGHVGPPPPAGSTMRQQWLALSLAMHGRVSVAVLELVVVLRCLHDVHAGLWAEGGGPPGLTDAVPRVCDTLVLTGGAGGFHDRPRFPQVCWDALFAALSPPDDGVGRPPRTLVLEWHTGRLQHHGDPDPLPCAAPEEPVRLRLEVVVHGALVLRHPGAGALLRRLVQVFLARPRTGDGGTVLRIVPPVTRFPPGWGEEGAPIRGDVYRHALAALLRAVVAHHLGDGALCLHVRLQNSLLHGYAEDADAVLSGVHRGTRLTRSQAAAWLADLLWSGGLAPWMVPADVLHPWCLVLDGAGSPAAAWGPGMGALGGDGDDATEDWVDALSLRTDVVPERRAWRDHVFVLPSAVTDPLRAHGLVNAAMRRIGMQPSTHDWVACPSETPP